MGKSLDYVGMLRLVDHVWARRSFALIASMLNTEFGTELEGYDVARLVRELTAAGIVMTKPRPKRRGKPPVNCVDNSTTVVALSPVLPVSTATSLQKFRDSYRSVGSRTSGIVGTSQQADTEANE